jgi:phospho-N-acetylmuramoyl-pentapeptide-transferase
MLPYLAPYLQSVWGPFRLLGSHLTLICLGACLSAVLTVWLLPRLWHLLPQDRGKNFVAGSDRAKGKPTGAGIIFVLVFLFCLALVLPASWKLWCIAACLVVSMLTGYFDDASRGSWGECKKGLWDAGICLAVVLILSGGGAMKVWLPLIKGNLPGGAFLLPAWLYLPLATALLWLSINVVNCSDGVDALAGSLTLLALFGMGAFLYGVLGHVKIANYLLIPHEPEGAYYAIMIFTAAGSLAGYIWHNAGPSAVMMGDAGSRFLGLLLGIAVLVAGNPFLYLAVATILFINGGAGLVKLVVFRLLRKCGYDVRPPLRNIPNPIHPERFASDEEAARQLPLVQKLHRFRCPMHDHCRKNLSWSDTQVVIRFMLLQAMLMPLLLLVILKLR